MLAAPSAAHRRSPQRGPGASWLGRLLSIAVAVALLAATVTSGRSWLFCTMMEAHVERCCCTPERDAAEPATDDGPAIENGCCEDQAAAKVSLGNLDASMIEVPPALFAIIEPAIVPSVPAVMRSAPPRSQREALSRASPIRAGPESAADTCVRLQVFRC